MFLICRAPAHGRDGRPAGRSIASHRSLPPFRSWIFFGPFFLSMWFHPDPRQPRFIIPPCVPILQLELLLATNAGRSYLLRDAENGLICCWCHLNTWRPLLSTSPPAPPPSDIIQPLPGTSTRAQHRREACINTMTCRLARPLARPGSSTSMPSPPPASSSQAETSPPSRMPESARTSNFGCTSCQPTYHALCSVTTRFCAPTQSTCRSARHLLPVDR